jgi:hypothetical protein
MMCRIVHVRYVSLNAVLARAPDTPRYLATHRQCARETISRSIQKDADLADHDPLES